MSDDPRISGIVPTRQSDPLQGAKPVARPSEATPGSSGTEFRSILEQLSQPGSLRFSRHALARVERRELQPTVEQLDRLTSGAELAAQKGSRSAAVLVDDLAFVVAVPARTVVTAIDRSQMKEQIFTNIDSAVIA